MRATAIIALIVLAGCGDQYSETEELCEGELMDDLRSPSTYSRISVESFATPINLDELQAKYLPAQLSHIDRLILEDLRSKEGVQLDHITIVYDAANAYGTPVRGEKSCYGLRVGGSPYVVPQAIRDADIDEIISEADRGVEPNELYDEDSNFSSVVGCCLPVG